MKIRNILSQGEQFYTDAGLSMSASLRAKHHWRFHMLNPWFAITFEAARLGFEAQNAAALQLMRLVGGTSKTEVRGMVTDEIAAPPDVPAAAAPPVVQAAAPKLASDGGGRGRESVIKVHKKRSRANKRKRSK
jgi:hypothetical protein